MNTMSCPLGDTTEVDAELAVACGSDDSDSPCNEEGVVALATLALSVTIGSEWSSVLSEWLSEDQMTSRMTSKWHISETNAFNVSFRTLDSSIGESVRDELHWRLS